MSDMYLARDGRDVARFRLLNRPSDEVPLVEIGGDWYPLQVDGDDSDLFLVNVHGPACTEPESGSVLVTQSGKSIRVSIDDVIRTCGRIYLK